MLRLLKIFFWFLKSAFIQGKYFLTLNNWERGENMKFFFIMFLIFLEIEKRGKKISNTFFDLWDLLSFGAQIKRAIFFHPKMAKMMLDPKHKGNRAWEYGLLLSHLPRKKNLRILDVGSGGSALPYYLQTQGAQVTAFDLEEPLEKPHDGLLSQYPELQYHQGSVLNLPFDDNSFDFVLCLSTIEHLDYNFTIRKTLSYGVFLKHTKKALSEMVRVVAPKGRLFITSEVYMPKLEKDDRYSLAYLYEGIGAGYKRGDFQDVFIDTLAALGCTLIGEVDFDFEQMLANSNRCNYRGRYFTTFSLYAEKKA